MITPSHTRDRVQLLSWPRPYAHNPYLSYLETALAALGVVTVSHRYLAALIAAPHRAHWLHLHWPEWMTRDPMRARARARAAWLAGLLDAARARGLRIAWTAHNLVGHDDPFPDLAFAARRQLLQRCDVVFGHFPTAEHDVRSLGFQGRFALAPHPGYPVRIDVPERSVARRALGVPTDARVLLAFGAIEPYKGLDRLAAAFARSAISHARLHIVGAPASLAALGDLAREAYRHPHVRIEARFVDSAAASVRFAAADAVVLAYRQFYTSGTAMLALSYGVPVIGPPIHHLADLLGRPFFVPMASPETLASAMSALEEMPPDAAMLARRYAAERTFDQMAAVIRATLFEPERAS